MTKQDELELRLKRLERLAVAGLAATHGVAIASDLTAVRAIQAQAVADAQAILREHEQAPPPIETRTRR